MAAASPWLIWQLADSAFPSGSFAHSGGLEAAWQLGEIRSRDDLIEFIRASLVQTGYGAVPFLLEVYRDASGFDEWDARCDVFLNNHVANRASRLQGKAFLAVVLRNLLSPKEIRTLSTAPGPESFCHLAPVLGWVGQALPLSREETVRLLLYLNLRGLISAAVRLGVVGPMDGQTIQSHLAATAEEVAQGSLATPNQEAWQTAPLIDLFQGAQDRLYSRLFQS